MKKFKLIALMVCILGCCSAFVPQKKKSVFLQNYGWSYYPGTGPTCYYTYIDFGAQCERMVNAPLCTIGGGGYPAYASQSGCQYKLDHELLYRVF